MFPDVPIAGMIKSLFIIVLISLPLALWKLFDIVMWVGSHIKIME